MKGGLACMVLIPFLAATANAQPVTGFYVQGSAGLALPQQQSVSLSSPPPASPQMPAGSSAAATANTAINGDSGAVQSGSAGWGFGNGFRMELQGMHAGQGGGSAN